MKPEIWVDVLQYDGRYQVSSEGNVRVLLSTGKYNNLHPSMNQDGVPVVRLTHPVTKKRRTIMVKTIVLPAFKHNPNPRLYDCIRCIDHDPTNVRLDNLEWSNRSECRTRRQADGLITGSKRPIKDLTNGRVYESEAFAAAVFGVTTHIIRRHIRNKKPVNGHMLEYMTSQGKKFSRKLFNLIGD